jgi:hypothetical protein
MMPTLASLLVPRVWPRLSLVLGVASMVLLPTRVAMPAVTNLRNLPFVPGTAFSLTYSSIELKDEDRAGGVTLVSATLTVAPVFGQTATLTKTVTASSTSDGQITDTAATDGVGALHIDISGGECSGWSDSPTYTVTVTDSLGRPTPLDSGFLVPATGHEYDFAPVKRVVVSPTALTVNMGSTARLAAVAVDEFGTPLTDRLITRVSSDTGVATVSTSGIVTATGIGTATITVTADGISTFAGVTVPVANFSDTFSRGNVRFGTSETGQVWQELDGEWYVNSRHGLLQGVPGTANKRVAVIETMRADCAVSAIAVTTGAYGTRLVVRCTDVDNYIFAEWDNGPLKLVRRVAFVDTVLATSAYTVAINDQVKIILSGSAITVQANSVTKIGPVTETFNVTATKHGLGAYDLTHGAFDNFLVEV